ncbi:MAG: hypothetical protein PF961_22055, partial [Planctomycetota bacterium]|nr:hypothetical protein [Planctomycetota bacterium]
MALAVVNLCIPGAGLLLRDRVVAGLALLMTAVAALALALLAPVVATPGFAQQLWLLAGGLYLASAASAGGLWWLWERPPEGDLDAAHAHARDA